MVAPFTQSFKNGKRRSSVEQAGRQMPLRETDSRGFVTVSIPMVALLTSCWLGFLVGLRHALDADHLAAVSTIVADHPKRWRAAFVGTCWGLGHSVALLVVGGLLLAWRGQLPARWTEIFELGVSFMLIGLGVRSLRRSLRASGAAAAHQHGGVVHVHEGEQDHFHVRSWVVARRPFLVGIAHGLAGTGSITALALASMPNAASALLYIGLFALGSIGGMALLTGAAGVPLERIARRPAARAALLACVGIGSLVVGLVGGAPIVGRVFAS
jgi:hypothetical protein